MNTLSKLSIKVSIILLITILSSFTIQKVYSQGPVSPEAVGFEPVDATDMVNLTNGNLSYVLPLLDVEGFPINLSYHAGVSPDMEASWVGLGWYLNPGAINRAANGTPDDWKDGIGINFTSFSETKTYYSITAGVGVIGTPVKIGIGAHWGGGQGLSGSIQANLGIASGYADTRGNFSASVGLGGIGASFSSGSKPNYSFAAGGESKDGKTSGSVGYSTDGTVNAGFKSAKGSLGISFSGTGSFSIGGAIKGAGASFSSSSSSQSQGDATIDTKSTGLSISVPIGPISFSLGFKKRKVKISIFKGYQNRKWGALYSSEYSSFSGGIPRINYLSNNSSYKDGFNDFMVRSHTLDSYSTRLPESEENFIGDYSKQIENLNFTFIAYDNYNVSAQGIMGNLSPRVFQNANIMGKGDVTENEEGDPIHVFWHHGSQTNNVQRSLTSSSKPFEFYFDGQFTRTESNSANAYNGTSLSSLNMNNLLIEGSHSGMANGNNRAHQGNFVEVFTNSEIANNQAIGFITPKGIPNNLRNNTAYFDPNGIGGYKITALDGKVYHFSLPVYHYERIQRSQLEEQEYRNNAGWPLNNTKYDIKNVNESRQFTRYATHWLLTAVTGPDYIDRPDPNQSNQTGTFNKEDYGYWVELEYGKWSDGFTWRTPHQDFVYDYNTDVRGQIGEDDKGNYQFGRKQIYYLDRINTKNRSALFIKDIRYDGYGKDLTFKFLNKNRNGNTQVGNSGDGTSSNSLKYTNPYVYVKETNVNYKREYTLRLDKIVLVDSEIASNIQKSGASYLGSAFPNYIPNSSHAPNWQSPYFSSHYGSNYSYSMHQEQNILDVGDIPQGFIENNALKTIKLNHNYNLVKNTPSSKIGNNTYGGNSNAGRLTLNSIQVLGRGNTQYMPPTEFTYYEKSNIQNPNFLPTSNQTQSGIQQHIENRRAFVDAWGFMQGNYIGDNNETRSKAEIWSLKEIKTPTGGALTINYEEDDYWTEAFARRYWTEGLAYTYTDMGNDVFRIKVEINPDDTTIDDFDFDDYFTTSSPAWIDLWTCFKREYNCGNSQTRHGRVDIIEEAVDVVQVTQDYVIFETTMSGHAFNHDDDGLAWLFGRPQIRRNSYNSTAGSNSYMNYQNRNRGVCPDMSGGCHRENRFTMTYKLLANKVPEDETGGGLRVKEIITEDLGNIYKATFDYSHPTENRSSGITSYAPVDGLKFVPYQSELPPPGVMYEYVTMRETDASGNFNAQTRYRHHVLKPVFNIFNPNIDMEVLDSDAPYEDKLFWASVEENSAGLNGNNSKKVTAKKIDININSALFGQVKSIELLNAEGHIINKTIHQYANGRHLNHPTTTYRGSVKETFNSLKTIFVSNDNGTQVIDNETKRLLSISSKTEYKNMLKKTITIANNHENFAEYSNPDPWLGSFRNTKIKLADGTEQVSTKVPAYHKYSQMGSKALNPNNKNMLTQEAMNVTTISNGNLTLNASITTWNNNWTYRDHFGNETTENDVWRKHKSFVWKDNVGSVTGHYATSVNESTDYFNWGAGQPTNEKWQNVSEVTRYTHWSSPIETKDVNNNFVSSKMADHSSKVVVAGNARYSEMYYSGAEHVLSGNVFEGEVRGALYQTDEVSHTGNYAVKTNAANDVVFNVAGQIGNDHNDLSKDFRPGKYKVSFWAHQQIGTDSGTKLVSNSGAVITEAETVSAGCWKQFNYYVDLQPNSSFLLYVTNTSGGGFYFDDFRMHPVASSINSYVYDNDTDELLYVLDANNMGSGFRYDKAGRLKTSYVEVENTAEFDGGFKITEQYQYNYQNTGIATTYNEDINNCLNQDYPSLTLKGLVKQCIPIFNPYDIDYRMHVSGGSGNYKYEWQWMTNVETGAYSNWTQSTSQQFISYAIKYCSATAFNKYWNVRARVTDLTTGEIINASDEYIIEDCSGYILNPKALVGVEASQCHDNCKDSKYQFHFYPLDPNIEVPQPVSYLDNNSGEIVQIDLIKDRAYYCPTIKYIESKECESGYVKYVSVTPIYPGSTGLTYEFYLECAFNPTKELEKDLIKSQDPTYAVPGTMLTKLDGKIISVSNINNAKR